MFKLGGNQGDLRNHLLTKAFGKHTKMILGYCSPQVGMAKGSAGPLGSEQKREGNGELKERRLTDAIISFSFITLGYFRLGRKKGKITEHHRVWTCVMCQKFCQFL